MNTNKEFKTSDARREYQRNYYKLRQQRLIETEKQKKEADKLTGGKIIQKTINDSSSSSSSSSSDSESSESKYTYKQINNVIPKIDKEKIVNFKLKQAISYISKNINKNAEDYIMDLADELGYNIESTDGCYEFLKILEKYLGKTF